jgi:peroxiredoxin Q/BCP
MSLKGMFRFAWKTITGGPPMLKPGDPAPDFEAPTHDGRRVRLSQLRGKKVVLWFYPKADTPG